MANLRLTAGAILGTVHATAVSVTTLVGVAVEAVDMLDAYVRNAALEQRQQIALDAVTQQHQLVANKAREMDEHHQEIEAYKAKQADGGAFYETAYAKLAKALNAAETKEGAVPLKKVAA